MKRSKRKRDLEMEALARLEDSTRTEEDFQNVITWWNRLDANRERKEHYHEIGRSDVPLEWGMSPDEIVIPAPIQHVFRKELLYQIAIKGYSCQTIAMLREQTDRNTDYG